MSYSIALNFEDGVTRFITCNEGETVLDAAYRAQINLPMDCSDGVCGTCKGTCHQGRFELGDEYIDEALSDEEAGEGQVLTCQMVPASDCVVDVPTVSSMCKTGTGEVAGTIDEVNLISTTTIELKVTADADLAFLPGQYVNLQVPGTGESRSYSFSSRPGSTQLSFLIRNVPGGLMSTYLVGNARTGDRVVLTGPMGTFYLRPVERPLLMLAGGTGLAPILAQLRDLEANGCSLPIHLVYGVRNDDDLVGLEELDRLTQTLASFSYVTCVSGEQSAHPRKGYVMDHLDQAPPLDSDLDVYLCGPPPMVDGVRQYLRDNALEPAMFHYEKFTPSVPEAEEQVA